MKFWYLCLGQYWYLTTCLLEQPCPCLRICTNQNGRQAYMNSSQCTLNIFFNSDGGLREFVCSTWRHFNFFFLSVMENFVNLFAVLDVTFAVLSWTVPFVFFFNVLTFGASLFLWRTLFYYHDTAYWKCFQANDLVVWRRDSFVLTFSPRQVLLIDVFCLFLFFAKNRFGMLI